MTRKPQPHFHPPAPGATAEDGGCTFAVESRRATRIWVCLFDENDLETRRVELTHRIGMLWFVWVENVKAGQRYGFRVQAEKGHSGVHPHAGIGKLLVDPYARHLDRVLNWSIALHQSGNESEDTAAFIPKALVPGPDDFDWEGTRKPRINALKRVIYELHVKGFTQLHPEVPAHLRGKYLGLCEPAVIQYLKSLRITTVQLMPCMSFMTEPRLQDQGLSNYWGYNPYQFFTPDWRYAVEDPVREFRMMVRALHKAGIEVILDVVYNHTAEGADTDGVISFRGLDDALYYRRDSNGHLLNYSGCGNSLKIEEPAVLRLVMDSLRYWYEDMQLDGFRFDLAASLTREKPLHDNVFCDGQSKFLSAIAQDPTLQHALLIAEPWDIGPDGYQLGSFPPNWLETNDRFRDAVRAFWRGDPVGVAELATRLMGSRDVFRKDLRPMTASINPVTYHDGFTLEDLVSYRRRHNEANGEEGRDGHAHNLSTNHGEEGPADDPDILARRLQHKRNLVGTLLLSRGTPHFVAGDERSRTQHGNNNAYCQDTPLSWLDWSPLDDHKQQFFSFFKRALNLRYRFGSINMLNLEDEAYFSHSGSHQHHWLDDNGKTMSAGRWRDPDLHFIALLLMDAGNYKPDSHRWMVLLNGSQEPVDFHWPSLPELEAPTPDPERGGGRPGPDWYCLISSIDKPCQPDEFSGTTRVPPFSLSLWHSGPVNDNLPEY